MFEQKQNERWFGVTDGCNYLNISKGTLYTYMKDGWLPFYYLAGTRHRRIKQEDLDSLLTNGASLRKA